MPNANTAAASPAPPFAPPHAAPTYPARPAEARRTGPILVATDGENGATALATARQLAARSGAAVTVCSAIEPPPPEVIGPDGTLGWVPDPALYVDARRARVEHQLHAAGVGGPGDRADVAWRLDVVVDEPSHALADLARARHAALIVMGSGRHDRMARFMGGEVTLRTVRRAPVPVLAVGRGPMRVPPMVAVVGVDFSPSSLEAARAALDLLGDGGTLHLVHAWSRDPLDNPWLVTHGDAYERGLPGQFAKLEAALLDRPRDVTLVASTPSGLPAEQIVAFAESHGADFVAAGRQRHGPFELLSMGRVTTAVLRAASCAVLVTPEPTPAERAAAERVLTGTSESRAAREWAELLAAFSGRNRGRRTAVEVDDPAFGAQAQVRGYALLGAAFDRHDGRVALMLGTTADDGPHLTRLVDGVTSVAVHSGPDGRDAVLRLTHGHGQTLLSFLPDVPTAPNGGPAPPDTPDRPHTPSDVP